MEKASIKNFNFIDIFKFISSLLVVAIHTRPFAEINPTVYFYFVNVVSRVAVPFFFAATGFFFFRKLEFSNGKVILNKNNFLKLWQFFKRSSLLYILWSAIFLIWQIPKWYLTGWLSFKAFVDFGISFFISSSHYHLWYLLSILYAVPVLFIALAFIKPRNFMIIAAILYFFEASFYGYSWALYPLSAYVDEYTAKAYTIFISFFRALPLIFTGAYTATLDKLPSRKKIITCAVTFFLLFVAEASSLHFIPPNKTKFSYIFFVFPMTLFLFMLATTINVKTSKATCTYLRKMSTLIYCIHPMIIYILTATIIKNPFDGIVKYIGTAACSVAFAYIVVKLSSKRHGSLLKYLY